MTATPLMQTAHASDLLPDRAINKGKVVAVRGSIVDVLFENDLPPPSPSAAKRDGWAITQANLTESL